jgi:hypothetical protein
MTPFFRSAQFHQSIKRFMLLPLLAFFNQQHQSQQLNRRSQAQPRQLDLLNQELVDFIPDLFLGRLVTHVTALQDSFPIRETRRQEKTKKEKKKSNTAGFVRLFGQQFPLLSPWRKVEGTD